MNVEKTLERMQARKDEYGKLFEELSDAKDIKNDSNSKKLRVDNIYNTEISRPIFRAVKWKYLKKMLEFEEDNLVHYESWEDPYEGYFFYKTRDEEYYINDGEKRKVDSKILNSIYGQCWTLNENESELTWKVYSPNKDKILIKTTIGKLWNSVFDTMTEKQYGCIGKVIYKNKRELDEYKRTLQLNAILTPGYLTTDFRALFDLFLEKRKEFEYENEVRVLYYDHFNIRQRFDENYFPIFKIKKLDFFEKFQSGTNEFHFLADPRMDEAYFDAIRDYVENANLMIEKSTLYKPLYD